MSFRAHDFGLGASVSGTVWNEIRRKAFLYVGFIATGVALTIPGALLPLLLVRWSMNDARGGLLLFSFYAVGSFGSYYARGRMNWSVARGAVLTVLGAICLGWAGRWTAYGAIALYGLGLVADDDVDQPAALAAVSGAAAAGADTSEPGVGDWRGAGAVGRAARDARRGYNPGKRCCPWATCAVGCGDLFRSGCRVVGGDGSGSVGFGGGFGGWAVSKREAGNGTRVPWTLLALIFGATGVDAAAGGWLTSYAQRAGDSLGITIGAATFLWLGALVSRMVHSTKWASRLPERRVLGSSMVAMTAALALLLAWPAGIVTMVAAAVLGLAAGPVYPLVIAAALRHRENSTVFAVAGVGASILPLLTGALSNWTHSLRAGLSVPLLAAAVMAALVAASGSALQGRNETVAEALIG